MDRVYIYGDYMYIPYTDYCYLDTTQRTTITTYNVQACYRKIAIEANMRLPFISYIYIYMHYANLTLSNVKYKYLYLIELRKLVVIHSNGMRQDLKVVGTLSVKFFRDRT